MYDVEDEESMDDPISLIYDGLSEDNVQKTSSIYVIEDDVEDDPISLIINPNEKYIDTDVVDLRSSDDEREEQHPTPKSGYGNKNFIIPVTFLDSYRNVKLLKKCKPLSIQIVDCDKHPWYYGGRGKSKSTVKVNCRTLGKYCNVIKQEIKLEKVDADAVILENERVNVETLATTQSLNDKAQDQGEIKNDVNNVTLITKTLNHNCQKFKNQPEIAKKSKDLSQVDYKRNSGLVGLTISKKDLDLNQDKVTKNFDSNLDKVTMKKTRKKCKKENIVNNTDMQEIGATLNNLGTSVTPIQEKNDGNGLESKTKDSHASNVNLHDLSSSSNTIDKINNNTISPTRCSLKITSSKILEKVIQLKKAKIQNTSKAKSQQKPKKIFDEGHEVPKLNLKRRSTTEIAECYSKKSLSNSFSVQYQEPQKDQNAVENVINKNSVETSPIIPSVTISVKNQQTFTPNTSINSEKFDRTHESYQTQCRAALATPRCYHKKLKHEKSTLNNMPNKIIQNESITPNHQDINASNCNLNSVGTSPIVSSVTISVKKQQKFTPNTSINATKLDQTQCRAALPTPKSCHKKLKLQKSILNNVPNKIIQNELITSICSKTPNKQDNNASNCGLTSGLDEVVVSQVQSLKNMDTLSSNRPNYETPKNTGTFLLKPKRFKLKRTKNIDTAAANSNLNGNKHNKKVIRSTDTTTLGTEVKKTHILQSPPLSFLQAYNDHVLNYYNGFKELSQITPRATKPDKNNSDPEILKNTENNATQQQTNRSSNGYINNAASLPKTNLYLQRFNDQKQLDEYLYMKQNQFNTQPNQNHTVNNFLPIKSQIYNLPGNNTVILMKPPAHIQYSTNRTPGLPKVVNNTPTNIPKPSTRTFSPWSFPPPNTNVASNVYNYSMPNTNIYSANQILYPQHYWQATNSGSPYLPPPPLVVQQEKNSNLIPVKNEVSDDSVIGTTANGALIKKISIDVPASNSTVVDDKQKMLDTLNNAINERNDFLPKISDPRSISHERRAKPCPLSKKACIDSESNVEPSKGYSPPILPIPSFQKAIELVKMKQKLQNMILSQAEKMDNNQVNTNLMNKNSHRPVQDISKRKKPTIENKNQDKTKKISLDEYKKRVTKDGVDANKITHKCKRKQVSKNVVVDNNQDLGYDSDATVKL